MFTKDETKNAAYAEILRFSVAISVQQERIAHWREELRNARKEWDDAAYKELFISSVPGDDFEEHLRSMKLRYEMVPKMHLKSEVQFLLISVRGIYAMALAVRWAVSEDETKVRCVQAAVSSFEKVAPAAVHLRNLHEHMDQVFQGKGDAFKKLPDPETEGAIALLAEDVAYEIGGKVWSINELAVAAKDLVRDIGRCLHGD